MCDNQHFLDMEKPRYPMFINLPKLRSYNQSMAIPVIESFSVPFLHENNKSQHALSIQHVPDTALSALYQSFWILQHPAVSGDMIGCHGVGTCACWHVAERSQGTNSCNVQNSPPQKKIVQPQMSITLRLGNPTLDVLSHLIITTTLRDLIIIPHFTDKE